MTYKPCNNIAIYIIAWSVEHERKCQILNKHCDNIVVNLFLIKYDDHYLQFQSLNSRLKFKHSS